MASNEPFKPLTALGANFHISKQESWEQALARDSAYCLPICHILTGMSSLIFALDDTQAYVVTDTLATKNGDGTPSFFATKAFYLPHLQLLIAGTGVAGFLDSWLFTLNYELRIRDVDDLNDQARNYLQTLWGQWKKSFANVSTTTTVYHFGISKIAGLVRACAYRSEDDFEPNRLQHGIHVKPHCAVPDDFEFPRDIHAMMEDQRRLQLKQPQADRIYLGGEIQCHHLTKDGYNAFTIGRFDDYEETAKIIFPRR